MIDFVGKRFWFFLGSAILIVVGAVSLGVAGLLPGIDFASGSSMRVEFEQPVDQAALRGTLTELGYNEATIQRTGTGEYVIRIREITNPEKEALQGGLKTAFGNAKYEFNSVSPSVAADTGRNAAIAIIVASVFILAYVAWAFRKMPKPFRWGTCAIVPLLHDVFIVVGTFSVMGWLLNVEVDALFITGILAVVGYSINNTIVVFDRIRDNMLRTPGKDFGTLVNSSILETFARSLNTSLTTLFVIVALFLFGGTTIHNFMLVLLVGVVVGTFSASCIAPQLLVVWEKRNWGLPWASAATRES
jgi:preprotein translocase subunit SecF